MTTYMRKLFKCNENYILKPSLQILQPESRCSSIAFDKLKNDKPVQMEWKLHFETNPVNLTTCLSEQCSFCTFGKHCFMRSNDY